MGHCFLISPRYDDVELLGINRNRMDKKSVQFLIIGLVVGFIVGALAVDRGFILSSVGVSDNDDTATSTVEKGIQDAEGATVDVGQDTRTTSGVVLSGKNTVDVENQSAGNLVTISLVELNQMGWVVVHEDAGGKPGNVLGAALVFAGEHSAVPVELLRKTEKGKTYYAMLHTDDGDKAFDLKKDKPIADSTGATIQISFVAE